MCGDGCTIGRVSRPATASTASATGRGTTASPRGAWYRRRETGSTRSTSCTSNRRFTTARRAGDADRRPLREPLDHVESRGRQPRVDTGDRGVGEPEALPDLLGGRVVVIVGRRGVVHTIDEGVELGFAGERQDEIELDALVRRCAAEDGPRATCTCWRPTRRGERRDRRRVRDGRRERAQPDDERRAQHRQGSARRAATPRLIGTATC